jgi:predicted RNA binding protein YcfA (HicA-like mRNA interferase family)
MNKKKLLERILSGSKSVRFNDFIALVEAFGFELSRIRGNHHIFEHPNIPEILNLQNNKGQVKPYQSASFYNLLSSTA